MNAILKLVLTIVVARLAFMSNSNIYPAQQKTKGPTAKAIVQYDTPEVRLEGILTERKVFGPPGYGETPAKDARTTIFILKLYQGITVEPAANADPNRTANLDPVKDTREIQLFFGASKSAKVRELIGRTVVATGTLNESVTASQYTKAWLRVETLDLSGK